MTNNHNPNSDHDHDPDLTTCRCGNYVPALRARLGYITCLRCGEAAAQRVKHTIAPLNKSNYMVFTDHSLLKQLNPKRT